MNISKDLYKLNTRKIWDVEIQTLLFISISLSLNDSSEIKKEIKEILYYEVPELLI